MTHRLATYGVISTSVRPGQEIRPTMRREPFPVAVNAAFYLAHPRLSGLDHEQISRGSAVQYLKQVNILWALAVFAGIFVLCAQMFRPQWLGVLNGALVSLISFKLLVKPAADNLLTELPAAAVLVWAAIALLRFVRAPSIASGALVGLAWGLLALTKASFFYICIVAFALVGVFLWLRSRKEKTAGWSALAGPARALGALALVFMLLCGAWMTRNFVHFGSLQLTERGGTVLFYRSLEMEQSLAGAYYVWSPSVYRSWMGPLTGYTPADIEPGGQLSPLVRENPDSILANRYEGRALYRAHIEAAGLDYENMSRIEQQSFLGRSALKRFAGDPLNYIAWLPAYAYRGGFVAVRELRELRAIDPALPYHVTIVLFLNFLVVACIGVVTMHDRYFAVFLLPAGLAAFHVLLTHNLSRYNEPLLPFFAIAAMIVLVFLTRRISALSGMAKRVGMLVRERSA